MNKRRSKINSRIKINPIHPKDMTKEHWLEDFKTFYQIIKENYPYLWVKERTHGYNWLDLKEHFVNKINNAKKNIEFLDIFMDAIQALQNRHTGLFSPRSVENCTQEGHPYTTHHPYSLIFNQAIKEAYEYWAPFMEEHIKKRMYFFNQKANNKEAGFNYEVLIIYHKGEYLIVDGFDNWELKFGRNSRVIAVNDIPIDDAIKTVFEKAYIDWDFKRNKNFVWKIDPLLFGEEAEFTIKLIDGKEKKVTFATRFRRYKGEDGRRYTYPEEGSETFTIKVWPDKKIGYLRLNAFTPDYYDERNKLLLAFYKQIENYNYLILDVRNNEGGNYSIFIKDLLAPLTRTKLNITLYLAFRNGSHVKLYIPDDLEVIPKSKFNHLPPEVLTDEFTVFEYPWTINPIQEVDFKGKIIILIDKVTFSSGDAFCIFCKETGFGKIYGIPTGGDGISPNPVFVVLPNSKLVMRIATALGLDSTGNCNEEFRVQPDVFYENKSFDHQELIDFVLNELDDK